MSGRPAGRLAWALLGAALVAAYAACAAALDTLQLRVEGMTGRGWSTGEVQLDLALSDDGLRVEAEMSRLVLPPPLDDIQRARLSCAVASWQGARIQCPRAALRLQGPGAAPQAMVVVASVTVATDGGYLSLELRDQPLAGGRVSVELEASGEAIRLRMLFSEVAAGALLRLLEALAAPPDLVASAGTVTGELMLRLRGSSGRLEGTLGVESLAFSGPLGLRAGESLDLHLSLDASRNGRAWRFTARGAVPAGLVYVEPLLVEVADEPVTLTTSGTLWPAERLELEDVTFADPQGASLAGRVVLNLSPAAALETLSLRLAPASAQRLYARYLKAFAGVGPLADLMVDGRVTGVLDWDRGEGGRAELSLQDVALGDADGHFSVLGLEGDLHWSDSRSALPSRLGWRSAQLRTLELGPASVQGRLEGRSFVLTAPTELAVLDGAVRLSRLDASALGQPEQRVEADIALLPLSLQQLSNRLAWLPLSGTVSGSFPNLVYADGRLQVGSDMKLSLFDGRVVVSDLVLEHPFGLLPVLRADVTLDGIDLGLLTRAFSFGSIEGHLDGSVQGLVLEGWRPVAFDAWLATPEDDPTPHRISQRAVDNLASLGGANAVLSSTFLRFFDEFSYDRLGLSCRLHAGICEMGGVAPAAPGYYIVKGGGLPPRVDVVGFNTRVDWNTLLERLRTVAGAGAPVTR